MYSTLFVSFQILRRPLLMSNALQIPLEMKRKTKKANKHLSTYSGAFFDRFSAFGTSNDLQGFPTT